LAAKIVFECATKTRPLLSGKLVLNWQETVGR
jgi:hypothetical protein